MGIAARSPWSTDSPNGESLRTSANAITLIRTVASLACCMFAASTEQLTWLLVGLAIYWVGDMLDGAVARWRDCETRAGAVLDLLCDRLNCGAFYVGLCWIDPVMAIPVSVYLFEFMVLDAFLSLAFLAWPIRSPNYFYVVDRTIWLWNWSKPAKALNSALFALLLIFTGWWQVGLVFALALVALKVTSLVRLQKLGLPIPHHDGVTSAR